ncbi:MAG: polymorphic toxin type 35 domain-containing protein [Streptococcaceae bacterium]|nr:polymorphic toxin type 35 domain-containing protein [Streptococcaceae bacterium]
MVIYNSSDSDQLIEVMTSNLNSAEMILKQILKGCKHLDSVIASGTLSGAAYKAGQTLFQNCITPMMQQLSRAITDIKNDLKAYQRADQQVRALGGHLDEANIKQLLDNTKALYDLVEQKIQADKDVIQTFMSKGFEGVATGLGELPGLYEQLDQLNQVKSIYEKQLAGLEEFSSSTAPLFTDSLQAFKYALQGVEMLNHSKANPDGTIVFPAGSNMTWLTKLQGEKFSSTLAKENKINPENIDVKWTAMNGAGQQFPLIYVNGKLDKDKTESARWAMNKMGWANFKKLAPGVLAELLCVNDIKILLDPHSSFAQDGMSFLSVLLTYFPASKAVKLAKAMEAAKLLKASGEVAVDLNKIGKAAGLTEKELEAFKDLWKSEQVSSKFASGLNNLAPNKVNHIMQVKHDWELVAKPPTWENVKPLVAEVMEKGVAKPYGSIPGVFQKQAKIGDEIVTVTYREINGKISISDAWVNY